MLAMLLFADSVVPPSKHKFFLLEASFFFFLGFHFLPAFCRVLVEE
jgi:hypothetical protein